MTTTTATTPSLRATLFDAAETIAKEIIKLRRGRPTAESKCGSEFARLKVRQNYNKRIKAMEQQHSAVWKAFTDTFEEREGK